MACDFDYGDEKAAKAWYEQNLGTWLVQYVPGFFRVYAHGDFSLFTINIPTPKQPPDWVREDEAAPTASAPPRCRHHYTRVPEADFVPPPPPSGLGPDFLWDEHYLKVEALEDISRRQIQRTLREWPVCELSVVALSLIWDAEGRAKWFCECCENAQT